MVRGECCICSSLLASPDPGRCGRVIKASKISLILQLWPTVALQMGESYSSSKCPWKLWSPYKITTFLHYWNSQSTFVLSKMQDIVSFWTGALGSTKKICFSFPASDTSASVGHFPTRLLWRYSWEMWKLIRQKFSFLEKKKERRKKNLFAFPLNPGAAIQPCKLCNH